MNDNTASDKGETPRMGNLVCMELQDLYSAAKTAGFQSPLAMMAEQIRQKAELTASRVEVARLRESIKWALGEGEEGFRERCINEGAYWWRKELRERAALSTPEQPEQPETSRP